MSLKLLADESVDFRIIRYLRNQGFETKAIGEENPGITDKEVIRIAKYYRAVLITEDSDFGEWIFAHGEKVTGIIYLRYLPTELQDIISAIRFILHQKGEQLLGKFTVITPKKVRIREL